jgi:hypothetical protein
MGIFQTFSLLFTALFAFSFSATAKDQILVLSGGGSPSGNHYSQYLQTKLLTDEMNKLFGPESVSVFFGAGNNEAEPRLLADVNRIMTDGNQRYTQMEFGVINGNRPATKREINHHFDSPEISQLKKGDHLFLFVSDHGMKNPNTYFGTSNNCINLWQYQIDGDAFSFLPTEDACLSVDELRQTLKMKTNDARVLFGLSQCFSGGFHGMSVRMQRGFPTADPLMCGFTATTDDTTASGCTPDVDGPGYKGYERYFTQQLTGKDVVTQTPLPYARKKTLKAAHIAAALEDPTKDIPLSTSDYYLLKWADRYSSEDFQSRTVALSTTETVKYYKNLLKDPEQLQNLAIANSPLREWFRERLTYLKSSTYFLISVDPSLKESLVDRDALKLEKIVEKTVSKMNIARTKAIDHEVKKLDIQFLRIFPQWESDLNSGKLDHLFTNSDLDWEKTVFTPQERKSGTEALIGDLIENYSQNLSAIIKINDPAEADSFTRIGDRRQSIRKSWLEESHTREVMRARREINQLEKSANLAWTEYVRLETARDHLRRILFIRKTIAAAATLVYSEDQKGLSDLMGLLECENSG